MLRDGEIRADTWLTQHDMAADLPHDLPARFGESLDGFFPGNIGEARHAGG